MKKWMLGVTAAGAMAAQTVGGPVLAYVVDSEARMHAVYGMPAAAHVGGAMREGVREAWGELSLLRDGTALRSGAKLEGEWARIDGGAFVDASGRELLVATGGRAAWRLTLPAAAEAVRVSASGERVLTLLEDESLAMWTAEGKVEFRMAASRWWSFAFAGERAMAYDPAVNSLFWLESQGGMNLFRKLDGEGERRSLALTASGRHAVLLGARAMVVPIGGGEVRAVDAPEGASRLEPLRGGESFLLTRDPARPLWVLDPEREDPFLVIPALAIEKGGQQ